MASILHRYHTEPSRQVELLFEGDPEKLQILSALNVDAKVSALLTHVTIMIAVVSLLYSNPTLGGLIKAALLLELLAYLIATYLILQCIKPITHYSGKTLTKAELEATKSQIISEAKKTYFFYRVAHAMNVGLTILLFLTCLLQLILQSAP